MPSGQPIGNLVVNLGLNYTNFEKGIDKTQKEIKRLNNVMKAAKQETDLFGKGSKSATVQLDVMRKAFMQHNNVFNEYSNRVKNAKKTLAENNAEIQRLKSNGSGATVEIKNLERANKTLEKTIANGNSAMAKAGAEMTKLRNEYSKLSVEHSLANSKLASFGRFFESAGEGAAKLGQHLYLAGQRLTQFGALVGVGTALIVKPAIDYEKTLAGVQKTTNASAKEMKELGIGFRNLAKEMPIAVTELNAIGQSAGQLGIHIPNIVKFTEVVAKIGTATNLGTEEAATIMARFANIMGMSQDLFSNLGSSLVELGNNFATTESEILNMSLGLAGAGKQIGLTESQILGIATALSSLGIASERGGSSMSKVFINMATAVSDGGKKLEQFAEVAGMTSEQFSNLFKQDSISAISAFIDGLGKASEKGTTAIEILQEMGIKEIRLRDTLLRAGGASKLFANAIETSNRAFKENIALNREFEIMNSTTASKLEIAKNKIIDVAISAGEKLLPALADLLDGVDPIVDGLEDLIRWFSELDDGTKKLIGTLGIASVALGPVLSGIGTFMFGVAPLLSGVSKLSNGLLTLSKNIAVAKGFGDIAVGMTSAGSAATATSGAVSALAGKVGLVGTALAAAAPYILGVTAVLGAGVIAWKLWGEEAYNNAKKVSHTSEMMKKWGTEVTDEVDKALSKTKEFGDKAEMYLNSGIQIKQDNVEKVTTTFGNMFANMVANAEDKKAKIVAAYEKLPEDIKHYAKAETDSRIAEIDRVIAEYQRVEERINEIYKIASDERRSLTANEIAEIARLKRQAEYEQAGILTDSLEEQRKIMQNYNKDVKDMSKDEINNRENELKNMIADTKKAYEERNKAIEEAEKQGILSHVNAVKAKAEAEETFKETQKNIAIEIFRVKKDLIERLNEEGFFGALEADGYKKQLDEMLKELGYTYEEMDRLAGQFESSMEKRGKYLVSMTDQVIAELNDVQVEASSVFEDLITDDQTGEIVANLQEVLQEATKSEQGWNTLKFITKHAELTTDAKKEIEEAVKAVGKWDELDPEEKMFLTSTNIGESMAHALQAKGKWDNLTLEQKELILKMKSNVVEEHGAIIDLYNLWDNSDFVDKFLRIDTNAPDSKEKMNQLVKEYTNIEDLTKHPVNVETLTNAPSTQEQVNWFNNSIKDLHIEAKKKVDVKTTTNADDTKNKVNELKSSWYSFNPVVKHTETTTNARSTMGTINEYIGRLFSIPTNITTTITARAVGGGLDRLSRYATGTSYAKGGLAWLGDGGKREPYLTPQGHFGVSPNYDTLYDLPRGTKVWSSIDKFKRDAKHNEGLSKYLGLLPRFANGTGVSFLEQPKRFPNVFKQGGNSVNSNSSVNVTYQINVSGDGMVIREEADLRKLAEYTIQKLEQMQQRQKRMKGERTWS